jgi:release factor glutamine methyltransferase
MPAEIDPQESHAATLSQMTVRTALDQGTRLFMDSAIPAPRLTAEVLLAHALRRERTFLYSHPEYELREVEWLHYGRYLHERMQGKPTQYITRVQEFYGRPFRVTPDVLIPRPETEHVIEAVLAGSPPRAFVDVGCGSGAIAVTLALETGAVAYATDVSLAALAIAAGNAAKLGATVRFIACDLASALAPASVDLLVSNPPYVPDGDIAHLQREVRDFEPRVALAGGPTGAEIYGRLITCAGRVVRPGGRIAVEIGFRLHESVSAKLAAAGWDEIATVQDLAGIPRVLTARRRSS